MRKRQIVSFRQLGANNYTTCSDKDGIRVSPMASPIPRYTGIQFFVSRISANNWDPPERKKELSVEFFPRKRGGKASAFANSIKRRSGNLNDVSKWTKPS